MRCTFSIQALFRPFGVVPAGRFANFFLGIGPPGKGTPGKGPPGPAFSGGGVLPNYICFGGSSRILVLLGGGPPGF